MNQVLNQSKKIDTLLKVEEYNYKKLKEFGANIQEFNEIMKQMSLEINNFKISKKEIKKNIIIIWLIYKKILIMIII